jgi:hypothetical protein
MKLGALMLGAYRLKIVISFWWPGEAFHELGVQSADASASRCFISVKHVSSFLSKSLDHGGQKVCGCVSVAILDLLFLYL